MNQHGMQRFLSDCGKAVVYVENDMALGVFHDFLLKLKGTMVDKMVECQKQEQAQTDSQKQLDKGENDGICS